MTYRYIPVLKTKVGEATALSHLSAHARSRLFPLIRATANITPSFAAEIAKGSPGMPIALCGEYHSNNGGGTSGFVSLFNALSTAGLNVIPAASIGADPSYISAINSIVGKNGVVLQVKIADLPIAVKWCHQELKRAPADVDLIVVVGDVSPHDPASFAGYVRSALLSVFPTGCPWRSITLSASSAAKDYGAFKKGRSVHPRSCLHLWQNIQKLGLPFNLDFSDYAQLHESLEEAPAVAMANATVSVRYCINDSWVILKGTQVGGGSGSPMRTQYQAHAIALTKEKEFNSLSYCWGDDQIRHYSTTTSGTGGRKEWVAVSLNRHISHVCDKLP